MNYVARWRCVKCQGFVTDHAQSHNDGVCPNCGNQKDSTFVDCYREVGQWVKVKTGFFRSKLKWVPKKEKKLGDFKFPTGVTPP